MKFKIDRTSFFKNASFDSTAARTAEADRARAAWIIQRWWKQLHLKKTADESYHYVHDLISLQQAQSDTLTKLEKFILDPKTQATTHQLLMHLEQTKDIALPTRLSLSYIYRSERQFLSAYMIASKSQVLFESPTDIDELLLSRSVEMLKSFEELCAFMSDIYLKEDDNLASPLAEKTPSVDKIYSNLDRERNDYDQLFMSAGKVCLEQFHLKQIAYYETFQEWESKNRHKLAKILITKYLEIESKRFTALNSVDPRMLELYEGYTHQQDTLRKRVFSLLGEEGSRMISEELSMLKTSLEACKWITSPTESLLHELALDPNLVLPPIACMISPKLEISKVLAALLEKPANANLIISLLEDVRHNLALFTPNNRQQITQLEQNFSKAAINNLIDTEGLHQGLYKIIYSLIVEIKKLESPAHVQETDLYLDSINQKIGDNGDATILLNEALNFIYNKMSVINLERKNYQINQTRKLIGQNIVACEQNAFETRLSDKQFNLEHTLKWIDQFVRSPESYRLDIPILCSKHLGTYVTHALLISILQQPDH
ncbi:MAG: TCP11-related protein, partial [bacterium]|nr:TCP11-related protein [bacterium]